RGLPRQPPQSLALALGARTLLSHRRQAGARRPPRTMRFRGAYSALAASAEINPNAGAPREQRNSDGTTKAVGAGAAGQSAQTQNPDAGARRRANTPRRRAGGGAPDGAGAAR